MSDAFATLRYERAGHVATVTLARPERGNAIDKTMNRELPRVWAAIESDPRVRVAIVTGAGDRALCTGADLLDMPLDDDPARRERIESIGWTAAQNRVTKPVICAINGLAAGAGLHFPADADIVLAAPHASLLDPHVAVGLIAALEPIALARRMPIGAVLKLALTGGTEGISAEEAHRLGLIDEIVPAERLMERAHALAEAIATHSPTAVARTKAAIWGAKEAPLSQALAYGWSLIQRQSAHPDFSEGVAAFAGKRKPLWADRAANDL